MKHLNEYDSDDLDNLLGDMIDLGLAEHRVYILLKQSFDRNIEDSDLPISYRITFPELDGINGKIEERHIDVQIERQTYKLYGFQEERLPSDKAAYLDAIIKRAKNIRYPAKGYYYNLLRAIATRYAKRTSIELWIDGELIEIVNNKYGGN